MPAHRRCVILRHSLLLVIFFCGCARNPEHKAAGFMDDGNRLYEKGDYARAILQFKNAIQALPAKPKPYYRLGLAYLAGRDPASALAAFTRAAELDPKFPEPQLMIARMMLASHNQEMMENAETRVQQVIAIAPDNVDAWNTLALANWQLGNRDEAEQHLQDALKRFPNDVKAPISLARIKLGRKDFEGAEQLLKTVVSRNPRSAVPLVFLGDLYATTGRMPEAEQHFRLAAQLEPTNGLPLLALAALQSRTGRMQEASTTYKALVALPDGHYKAAYASFLFEHGKIDEAIAEFRRLADADPNNRDWRTGLVRAYLKAGRIPDAEKILREALTKNKRDIDALLQRSLVYIGAGDYAAAQNDLAQVLYFRPDSAQAHYLLAKIHIARGAFRSQRQELGEALRLDPGFLLARIELSQALIAANLASAALQVIDDASLPDRDTLPAIVARNWALIAVGDMTQLRKNVPRGLTLARVPDLLIQKALLALQDRDYATAKATLKESLNDNPEDLRALELLVRTDLLETGPASASQKLREYVSAHSGSASVQYFRGKWELARGNQADARIAFAAAQAAAPNYAPARLAFAGLDVAQGRFDDARTELLPLLNNPKAATPARFMLANVEQSTGNHAAAISQYKKVLDNQPDNAVVLNNLAYLLAEYGDAEDKALSYAQRAKQLSPDDAAINDTLGWVLFRKGQFASALQHFTAAVTKESTPRRLYHLAMASFKNGEYPRGRHALQLAMQKDPNLPEAAMAKQLDTEFKRGM